ncbi:uncharacterized protein LOC120502563 [Passer montanus]|uniref:uncharacterized protein LOC120502563 n=1 Tax=Passer montanus TaxID=9160 RepID=UPI0019614DD3|nr:uncharacterized protein LOC120502563 [Passer montanus]
MEKGRIFPEFLGSLVAAPPEAGERESSTSRMFVVTHSSSSSQQGISMEFLPMQWLSQASSPSCLQLLNSSCGHCPHPSPLISQLDVKNSSSAESSSHFPGVVPLWKVAAEFQVPHTEGQRWILSCGFAFPQTSSCFPFSLRMSSVPHQSDEISLLFWCKGKHFLPAPGSPRWCGNGLSMILAAGSSPSPVGASTERWRENIPGESAPGGSGSDPGQGTPVTWGHPGAEHSCCQDMGEIPGISSSWNWDLRKRLPGDVSQLTRAGTVPSVSAKRSRANAKGSTAGNPALNTRNIQEKQGSASCVYAFSF